MTKSFDRTVLITGGSSGIGAAIARRLSARGARVALLSRGGGDLGLPESIGLSCDVGDAVAVESATATVAEHFGGIDVLVPNAGVASAGRLVDVAQDRIEEMIRINLLGTINAVRAAYPYLRGSDHAHIVGICSEAGRRGFPNEATYCASKFGQLGFMRSLDHEARADGIRVTTVCPGGVATNFAVGDGRGRHEGMPEFADMLTADDVAYIVEAALLMPERGRVLELVVRHNSEASWG